MAPRNSVVCPDGRVCACARRPIFRPFALPLQVDSMYPNNPVNKTSIFFKELSEAITAQDSEVGSLCVECFGCALVFISILLISVSQPILLLKSRSTSIFIPILVLISTMIHTHVDCCFRILSCMLILD